MKTLISGQRRFCSGPAHPAASPTVPAGPQAAPPAPATAPSLVKGGSNHNASAMVCRIRGLGHGYLEVLLVESGLCLPQSRLYSKMRVPNFSNS